jgi:hypothetical protein
MKYTFCVLIFIVAGCNSPNSSKPAVTSTASGSNVDTTLYAKTDSITVVGGVSDTLVFSKKDFNEIVDHFPELYSPNPIYPDESYGRSGIHKHFTENGKEREISFGSEVGQDEYYILYSYFLKKKNRDAKFAGRRDTLIQIYNDINQIFQRLMNGGTYFGHQRCGRIGAYTEYSIYLFNAENNNDQSVFFKTYSISLQKQLFIKSLRQFVADEVNNDNSNGLSDKDKKEKTEDINDIIDHLNGLLTEYFYLERSQEFRYSKYQY